MKLEFSQQILEIENPSGGILIFYTTFV